MPNSDTDAAWSYHNSTKHSYYSVRNNPHFLDWANQPRSYKVYRGIDPMPLPKEISETNEPALSPVAGAAPAEEREAKVTLQDLASILLYSAGITRRRRYPGGELCFRAAACTGALYSIELYAVCGNLEGLAAGVYHFSPHDFSIRRIRSGDHRGALVEAAAGDASVARAPVTIVCTGTYWRNAWKYQARTYRHFGWDNGTILANLLAISTARSLPARIVLGFVDDEVHRLLGLDPKKEVALSLVPLGRSMQEAVQSAARFPALLLDTLPYSGSEVDYPEMRRMHEASSLATKEEVRAWREKRAESTYTPPAEDPVPLKPLPADALPGDSIERVILRRGSSRRFAREAISFAELSTVLIHSTGGFDADFLNPDYGRLNGLYVVAHAVEGLAPGAYFLHQDPWGLELLKKGEFREQTGYIGLEQELPADCSAAVFFLADLSVLLNRMGNRGYRAVQLESGVIGGRIYLAAYAQRLGATGLTFYDDDVTEFFSPHAAGKSAIFLMALGRSAKRIRSFP